MKRTWAAFRISIGLVGLTSVFLLTASLLGLVPDQQRAVLEGRKSLCEAIAVHCSLAANRGDVESIRVSMAAVVQRNADVLSASVRQADGRVVAESHKSPPRDAPAWPPGLTRDAPAWPPGLTRDAPAWPPGLTRDAPAVGSGGEGGAEPAPLLVTVPIQRGREPWGTVVIGFRSRGSGFWFGVVEDPLFRLIGFLSLCCLLAFLLYLRRVLRYLDPSSVIPKHVQAALNTLAEGVLVLDKHEQIVLANEAFVKTVGRSFEQLQGRYATEIDWTAAGSKQRPDDYPWLRANPRRPRAEARHARLADGRRGDADAGGQRGPDPRRQRPAAGAGDLRRRDRDRREEQPACRDAGDGDHLAAGDRAEEPRALPPRHPRPAHAVPQSPQLLHRDGNAMGRVPRLPAAPRLRDGRHRSLQEHQRHGHLAGDEVLKAVAAALQGALATATCSAATGAKSSASCCPARRWRSPRGWPSVSARPSRSGVRAAWR